MLSPIQRVSVQILNTLQDLGKERKFGRPFINGPPNHHSFQLRIRLSGHKIAAIGWKRLTRVLGINADLTALQLFLIFPGEYQFSEERGTMTFFEGTDDLTGEVIEVFVSGRDIAEMPPLDRYSSCFCMAACNLVTSIAAAPFSVDS